MAVFSRRSIQRALNSIAGILTQGQAKQLADGLNTQGSKSLETEWEVMLLSVFCRQGRIQHEPPLGTKRPDLLFQAAEPDAGEFLADIRTVSDDGLHDENPFEYLVEEFSRLLGRRGLTRSGFRVCVEEKKEGEPGDQKRVLCLPPKGKIPALLRTEVAPLIAKVLANPLRPMQRVVKKDEADFTIYYHPANRGGFSGSFGAYDTASSLTRNPVFNALKRKAEQLAGSGYEGIRGVILCDGDCHVLHRLHGAVWEPWTFSLDQIAQEIFSARKSLSFVLAITAAETVHPLLGGTSAGLRCRLLPNPGAKHPVTPALVKQIDEALRRLPVPVANAISARRHLLGKDYGKGFSLEGTYETNVNGMNTIRIPARPLVEQLAGIDPPAAKVSGEGARSSQPDRVQQFFLQQILTGCTIQSIKVEKLSDVDDDHLVIEFGPPDPAISPFVASPSPSTPPAP